MNALIGNLAIGAGARAAQTAVKAVDPALEKAAHAFEAIFVRQMIGAMRSASLDDGMFDNGGSEQFRDMADARTADALASKHAMGIADLLLQQLAPLAAQAADAGEKTGTASKPGNGAAA